MARLSPHSLCAPVQGWFCTAVFRGRTFVLHWCGEAPHPPRALSSCPLCHAIGLTTAWASLLIRPLLPLNSIASNKGALVTKPILTSGYCGYIYCTDAQRSPWDHSDLAVVGKGNIQQGWTLLPRASTGFSDPSCYYHTMWHGHKFLNHFQRNREQYALLRSLVVRMLTWRSLKMPTGM